MSAAIEDYLKAIYDLGGEGVKTQSLADALSVSAASVSGMIKKLSELKLADYEKYRGVSLTPAGQKIALETLRHHRLIETYLADALGYPWHDVHDEAERLEHVTHPLLKFMPLALDALPERFQKDTYQMKLYLFGFLPLGHHTIRVVTLDPLRHELYTEESGTLVKTWDHRITLRTDAQGRTLYSDGLSLDAGRFTPIIWVFAGLFYRYRQARWRELAPTSTGTLADSYVRA